jgi:hypothetical protein
MRLPERQPQKNIALINQTCPTETDMISKTK